MTTVYFFAEDSEIFPLHRDAIQTEAAVVAWVKEYPIGKYKFIDDLGREMSRSDIKLLYIRGVWFEIAADAVAFKLRFGL